MGSIVSVKHSPIIWSSSNEISSIRPPNIIFELAWSSLDKSSRSPLDTVFSIVKLSLIISLRKAQLSGLDGSIRAGSCKLFWDLIVENTSSSSLSVISIHSGAFSLRVLRFCMSLSWKVCLNIIFLVTNTSCSENCRKPEN